MLKRFPVWLLLLKMVYGRILQSSQLGTVFLAVVHLAFTFGNSSFTGEIAEVGARALGVTGARLSVLAVASWLWLDSTTSSFSLDFPGSFGWFQDRSIKTSGHAGGATSCCLLLRSDVCTEGGGN